MQIVPGRRSKAVSRLQEIDTNIIISISLPQVKRVGPGLYNNGNTCFLNSTLQCLFHVPPLAQILLHESALAMRGLNREDRGHNEKDKSVLFSFQMLNKEVWQTTSNMKCLSPRTMWHTLRKVGKQFKQGRQVKSLSLFYVPTLSTFITRINPLECKRLLLLKLILFLFFVTKCF